MLVSPSYLSPLFSCHPGFSVHRFRLHRQNPGLLCNLCFSRYVDQAAWGKFKTIDFVPPEGAFKLATYRVCSGVTPPVTAHADFSLSETGGKMKVTVDTKQVMQGQLYFPENVVVDIPLPLDTVGVNFLASVGSFTFDQKQKVLHVSHHVVLVHVYYGVFGIGAGAGVKIRGVSGIDTLCVVLSCVPLTDYGWWVGASAGVHLRVSSVVCGAHVPCPVGVPLEHRRDAA